MTACRPRWEVGADIQSRPQGHLLTQECKELRRNAQHVKSTLQKYKSVFSVLIYSQNHAAVAPIPEHVNPTLPRPWRSCPARFADPHASVCGCPSSHLPGTGLRASAAPPFRVCPCRACFQASFLLMAKVLGCFLVSLAGKHSSSCRFPILSLWKRVNGHEDQGQKRRCFHTFRVFILKVFKLREVQEGTASPFAGHPHPGSCGFHRCPCLMISDAPTQS